MPLPGSFVGGSYPCDLKRADDAACTAITEVEVGSGNLGDNYRCASGYCDSVTVPATPTCEDKLGAGATCTYHPACPVGQFCNVGMCADAAGAGEACTAPTLPCEYELTSAARTSRPR